MHLISNDSLQIAHLFYCSRSNRSTRAHQDDQHSLERLRHSLDVTGGEKQSLERQRLGLIDQIEALTGENQRLLAANGDAQRSRAQLEDEKEDVSKDKERLAKENERWLVGVGLLGV